jgi:hypothetical protein
MQFKRWRIVPGARLVNAGLASCLYFLSACGSEPAETASEPAPPEASPQSDVGLELPAVWNTTDLDGPVSQLALAGGGASLLAIVYEDGGLQLFDLEAERVTDTAAMDAAIISTGAYADFAGVPLSIFPGVSGEGELVAYLYGEALGAPQAIALPIEAAGAVLGMCSRGRSYFEGGILDLAFWTDADPDTATIGVLSSEDGELSYEASTVEKPADAVSCAYQNDGPVFLEAGISELAVLNRPAGSNYVGMRETGELIYRRGEGAVDSLGLRDGISVRVPESISDIAALGMAFGGGYPEGLIVVAGPVAGHDQVVFVDAGALTRPDVEASEASDDALD